MRSLLGRRPSPAMVIALIALFVSLGGVSYGVATGSIDSREIKNNTVRSKDIRNNQVSTTDLRNNSARGRDVRNNSLTGSDVLESSLGKVPNAASADTAGSAGSANTAGSASTAGSVGGVTLRRFSYLSAASSTPVQVLDLSGLRLTATCTGGQLVVNATTTVGNAALRGYGVLHGSNAPAFTNNVEQESANAGFETTDNTPILPTDQNDVRGYLTYYRTGAVVNVDYTADEPGGGNTGSQYACVFTGTASAG